MKNVNCVVAASDYFIENINKNIKDKECHISEACVLTSSTRDILRIIRGMTTKKLIVFPAQYYNFDTSHLRELFDIEKLLMYTHDGKVYRTIYILTLIDLLDIIQFF